MERFTRAIQRSGNAAFIQISYTITHNAILDIAYMDVINS